MGVTSPNPQRHLEWKSFFGSIRAGIPLAEVMPGPPRIECFIEAAGRRIGIRIPWRPGELPGSLLDEISVCSIRHRGKDHLEVAVTNPELFREFYSFCCSIADRVQLDKMSARDAVEETMRDWSGLLRKRTLLDHEKQVGLFGELLMLRRLSEKAGWDHAIRVWQGPSSEEHDFVLDGLDLEVKTTTAESRHHVITSLTQLLPKPGRPLFLVSLQITIGTGPRAYSLSDLIATCLVESGVGSPAAAVAIRDQLNRIGWRDSDAAHYGTPYLLRTPPVAIPIDRDFPAILPSTLEAISDTASSRILNVEYRINVDGLGTPEGSRRFSQIVFGGRKK